MAVCHGDDFANGISIGKELVLHVFADERDLPVILILAIGEETSGLNRDVIEDAHVPRAALDTDLAPGADLCR